MKGISPLVASVLLIAITMSVAGILAFWVSNYTTQTLPKYNRTEECRFSNFEIWRCVIDGSTGNITLVLHNIGQYEILDLTAFILTTDNTITPMIKLNSSLLTGEYKSFIISNSSIQLPVEKISKLIIGTAACPELTREEFCKRS